MPTIFAVSKKLPRLCILLGITIAWLNVVQASVLHVENQLDTPEAAAASNHISVTDDRVEYSFNDWPAVGSAELDGMRGGFSTDAGLQISFGIQRSVYINGNLVTATNVNIQDIGNFTSEQAKILSTAIGTVNLIQNGPANTFQQEPMSHAVAATVIQNTLNNQNIKSLTSIDTTVNSLAILKGINFQLSLQHALGGR